MQARMTHALVAAVFLVAAGVIAGMTYVSGLNGAAAVLVIFPAFFLIAVMPVWNATRMRTQERVQVESEVIEVQFSGRRA